jgi:hypothetical protein
MARAEVFQSLVSHYWPEVRAADADVDDVADALARVTFPRIASHALGKVRLWSSTA